MIYQFLKKINIDRPYVFYTLVFLILVLPLTYINNYYYYKSITRIEKTEIFNLANTINSFSKTCIELSSNNTKKCIGEIKTLLDNNADYYGNLVTINNEDAILFSYDNRRYSDSREPISLGYNKRAVSTIDALSATLNITRNSIPNIWSSVYRSITFSIVDVMKKDGIDKKWNYIKSIAFPRSAPFLSFLFLTLLVVYLLKKSIIAQIELINEFEAEELEELKDIKPNK
jgi:hypothetical protein